MATQLSKDEQEKIDNELWESARNGNLENAKQAIQKGANLKHRNLVCYSGGRFATRTTPHTIAYVNGHNTIVEFLGSIGATPDYDEIMLAAAVRGQVDIVKEAIEKKANVNNQHLDRDNDTALHLASGNGHTETVRCLLLSNADPNISNKNGQSPAHTAINEGHTDVLKLLIEVGHIDVNATDNDNNTALHLASGNGYLETVQFLLQSNADPNIDNKAGRTAAHCAAQEGHVDVLKLLIEMGQADINVTDKNGDSLLHLACSKGKVDMILYLLHTGKVNPLAHNNIQNTPLEEVLLRDPNRFEILKMFEPFERCRQDYPVDSYRKVFFCGNTTAGKSSLAQCIIYRADKPPDYHYNPSQCVEGVQFETAGISYHNVRSHEVGNIILYDFAGHQEYYSSHAAVLENLMLTTPAVFTIVIDSTRDFDYFKRQLYYWSNFIDNACTNLTKPSQVIVVGSFADKFTNSYDEFKSHVNYVAKVAISKQEYRGFVAMECHRPGGKGFPEFIVHLRESCEATLDKSDNISYYCHVHYAYLQKLQKVAISLNELIESLKALDDPSLPSDETVLVDYLSILSDKGLVLFLRNKIVSNSWIVIDKSNLIAEVNGVLFNQNIKRLPIPTSSNTGIVHVSVLQDLFEDYDTSMLIDFLISMEFCHVIDSDTLNAITTNLSSSDVSNVDVLFFPALITGDPPSDLNDLFESGFGWCLYCPNPFQFLSVRFLHVLLLRLAYLFCLPRRPKVDELETESKVGEVNKKAPIQQLNRRCTVWENGIYWNYINDVVVEVTDNNRCVTVFVSNLKGVESQKICCSVIKLILSLQKQFCPCKIEEYIIPSGSLADIRSKAISKRILYEVRDLARGMLFNEDIFDHNEVQNSPINVKQICPHEPYISLAPAVINALFSHSKASEVIPETFLQHIQEFAPGIMSSYNTSDDYTYSDVASHLNDYSFFIGQNPLVLSSQSLTRNEILSISKDRILSTNISTLKAKPPKRNELLQLMSSIAFQWNIIGDCLGIQYVYLASLQRKTSSDIEKLSEVLQHWMDTMPKPVTWNTILQTIESPPIGSKVTVMEIERFLKSQTKGSSDICDDDLLELLTTTGDDIQTDKNTIEQQSYDMDESVHESISNIVSDTIDPSEIYQEYFADICEAIVKVKPMFTVNRLFSAKLISSNFKKDVQGMSGEDYDKANKIVNELQRQVEEKGIEFLKSICDFLLKQNNELKDIGRKMKHQLQNVTHTDKNIIEQQSDGKLITKRSRSFFHSTSKKLKQSDNTDDDQLDTESAHITTTTGESDLESTNLVESNDNAQSMEFQENDSCLSSDYKLSPPLHESSTKQKETNPCKRKVVNNVNSDDLPESKKFAQEPQESNIRGAIIHRDKNTIGEQTDDIDEIVGKSITEDNNTVSGKFNASKIFRIHSANLCDKIVDANPHRIVNKLVSSDLLPTCTKEDVKSTPDIYDKADKIVERLQRQIDDDEHSIELLKKICDFLLEQTDKTLKDIGTKMMSQL